MAAGVVRAGDKLGDLFRSNRLVGSNVVATLDHCQPSATAPVLSSRIVCITNTLLTAALQAHSVSCDTVVNVSAQAQIRNKGVSVWCSHFPTP
jgi:hypothetical protein